MAKDVYRVFVGGDWDADGVIAAALMTYAQEKVGLYPYKGSAIVDKKPVDPERIIKIFGDLKGSYDALVLLDLPYSERVFRVLSMLKNHFSIGRIIYIDHHLSSISNVSRLKSIVDELYVYHEKPTSVILYEILVKNNIRVHQRLKSFVEVVRYMDSGLRVPDNMIKLFELTKLFSKALTIVRDEDLWVKIVDWLASPTILPNPIQEDLMNQVKKIIEERDREIEKIALDLAVSAVKISNYRFIDARNIWRHRGASSLASKLSSILRKPVILLVDTKKDYSLLIIKASGGRAYRVAKYLMGEGIGLDIAGHPNLAIVKIGKKVKKNDLINTLYRAVYYST